jgi:hypothetical protein
MLVFATSGLALEKTPARGGRFADMADGWSSGATCSVQYYNRCHDGLPVLLWSGWGPGDCLGTCFESCCAGGGTVSTSAIYVWTAAPSGYGYTGTISTFEADGDCCPTAPIESQAFFPQSGWNHYSWNTKISGDAFVIQVCLGPGAENPISFVTDRPEIGCGLSCFRPCDRPPHSFYYGNASTAVCPGSPFYDGIEAAELLHVAALTCVVSVEEASWGRIKGIYR